MNKPSCNISHGLHALVTVALLTLLAGCSPFGGPGIQPDQYTLSPAPSAAVADHGGSEATRIPLTLYMAQVTAPNWLDSKRMIYRLDYSDNQQLASYTRSKWATMPAEMVTDSLRASLRNRHLFAAVVDNTTGQNDLSLQLGLTDFSQHFSDTQTSQGHIGATATLINARTGDVIAQRTFKAKAPAPSADAAGGVKALTAADRKLNTAVSRWLSRTVAACRPDC